MKYEKLCKPIVSNIGNKSNVVSVTHCMTRLRIEVRDTGRSRLK
ncbi:MAG: PTS transporter subunit EIIB [Thomasclavelia ramosa]